jgi:integrase
MRRLPQRLLGEHLRIQDAPCTGKQVRRGVGNGEKEVHGRWAPRCDDRFAIGSSARFRDGGVQELGIAHVRRDPFANMKPLKETRVEANEPLDVPATAAPVSLAEVAQFKTATGDADPFAPSEANAILERAYGPILNMVMFWLDQGLRPGELLGVQWQDVDLAAGTVTLRRSISKGKVKTLKVGQKRTIKLYPAALAALESQAQHSGAQRAWVFPNPATGQRFANESKFNRRWARLVKAASVRYRPPKQLRHTTASTLVSAGVPIIEAGRFLGHKDMTMIALHYGQFISEVGRLPGATFEEKFAPIWARRIEMLRLQQQVPEEGDWLGLYVEDKAA